MNRFATALNIVASKSGDFAERGETVLKIDNQGIVLGML